MRKTIPDLPFKDYEETYKPIADRYDIRVIMLITPETSEARVREIDAHTDGFIYLVSSAATTGAQKDFDPRKQAYFKKIEDMNLRNPRMVGFGISNKQTFDAACAHSFHKIDLVIIRSVECDDDVPCVQPSVHLNAECRQIPV